MNKSSKQISSNAPGAELTFTVSADLPVLDEARFRENFAGLENLVPSLVQAFFTQSPGMMARIEAAVKAGDAAATRSAAHAFKGVLLQMFASRSAPIAAELERRAKAGELAGAEELCRALATELVAFTAALGSLDIGKAA